MVAIARIRIRFLQYRLLVGTEWSPTDGAESFEFVGNVGIVRFAIFPNGGIGWPSAHSEAIACLDGIVEILFFLNPNFWRVPIDELKCSRFEKEDSVPDCAL